MFSKSTNETTCYKKALREQNLICELLHSISSCTYKRKQYRYAFVYKDNSFKS